MIADVSAACGGRGPQISTMAQMGVESRTVCERPFDLDESKILIQLHPYLQPPVQHQGAHLSGNPAC